MGNEVDKILSMIHNEGFRDYVGLSQCGHHPLLLALAKLGYRTQFNNKTRMIFFTGHLWEALLIDAMKEYGVDIRREQETVHHKGYKGHIDAMDGDNLLEFKTMSDKSFKQFIKNPMSNMKYVYQLSVYYTRMFAESASWICLNKQTMEVAQIPLPLDVVPSIMNNINETFMTLERVNTERDLEIFDLPDGREEVYKKEPTGNLLLPMFISNSPFAEAFYYTVDGVNKYGKEVKYVDGKKTIDETIKWLSNYEHKL